MEEKEVVGIDMLKKFIKESVEVYRVVCKQLEDGYQWTDVLPIVWEAKDLSFMVSNWENFSKELKDLSFEEFDALINSIIEEIGGTTEEIKELIMNASEFIEASYKMYLSVKKISKK